MLHGKLFILFFLILQFPSFSQSTTKIDKEKIKLDIKKLEKDFENDLKKDGVASAFYKYAAENAVIKRENDTLIYGNDAIRNYYSNDFYKNAVAEWNPDYIDVSDDGSMAYTYGKYEWKFKDKSGKQVVYKGVFNTVWKKMKDGSWKYVWD